MSDTSPGTRIGEVEVVTSLQPDLRVRVDGIAVETDVDEAWAPAPYRRDLDLSQLRDVARALATGQEVVRRAMNEGREYRAVYAFRLRDDSPRVPGLEWLWFLPPDGNWRALRVRTHELVPALMAEVQWALQALGATGPVGTRLALEDVARDLRAAAQRLGR